MDKLLTVSELSEKLDIHPITISRLVRLGKIPAINIAVGSKYQSYRFNYAEVIKALEENSETVKN